MTTLVKHTMMGPPSRDLLLQPSPIEGDNSRLIGRDPRNLTPGDFAAAGVELLPVMKAIRTKCLDCAGGSPAETRKCVSVTCALWPLRLGVFPSPLRAAANAREAAAPEEILW